MKRTELFAWVCVGIGLAAGAFIFASRPQFWIEFGAALFAALAPFVWRYIAKRHDAETEARWRECQRQGGKWNHRTRKCE